MKRLLSALLTLALVLSLIPAVFAEDTAEESTLSPVTYNFIQSSTAINKYGANVASTTPDATFTEASARDYNGTKYYLNTNYFDTYDTRTWKLFDVADDILPALNAGQIKFHNSNGFQLNCASANANVAATFAFSGSLSIVGVKS